MQGRQTIKLDYKDFIRGSSSSDHLGDGGFSPTTTKINPKVVPGAIYAPPTLGVVSGSALGGAMIASCGDNDYLGNYRMFLDDSGVTYSWDGTTLTTQETFSSDKVTFGTTDMVAWNGMFYITTNVSNTEIAEWDEDGAAIDEDWWTTVAGGSALQTNTAWRPLLVYERHMYVGDGKFLHRVNESEVVSSSLLTLSDDDRITALGIDKGSGNMLIAVVNGGADFSALRNGDSKILVYDGTANKALKVIPTSGLITAFLTTDDRTLVFYANKIGYFTGNGIKFLRTLGFSTGTFDDLNYKHKVTVHENTAYFIDGDRVIAYGEIISGQKVFYPVYQNSGTELKFLSIIGAGKLGISHGTTIVSLDLSSTSSIQESNFFSNKIHFPRPVIIQEAFVEWASAVSDTVTPAILSIIDESQTATSFGSTALQNSTGASAYFARTDTLGVKVRTAQIKIVLQNSNVGIRRVVINYDVVE